MIPAVPTDCENQEHQLDIKKKDTFSVNIKYEFFSLLRFEALCLTAEAKDFAHAINR
jgi:hypothetical protein